MSTQVKVAVIGAIAAIVVAIITVLATRSDRAPTTPIPPSTSQANAKSLSLGIAPDTWGKVMSGASGKVMFSDNLQGTFAGTVELRKLVPNHQYALTLNGKPSHPSNGWLPQKAGDEGYLDFKQVSTDSDGNVKEEFSTNLPSGGYEVKFFVKDTSDWKIVLYSDFLQFKVR